MSDDIGSYGPQLPPGYSWNQLESSAPPMSVQNEKEYLREAVFSPSSTSDESKSCESLLSSMSTGDNRTTCKKEMIGPIIPEHLKRKLPVEQEDNSRNEDSNDICDSESNCIGPLPPSRDVSSSGATVNQIEDRANKMKSKLLNLHEEVTTERTRESWMTDLPPEFTQNYGVTARTFRSKVPAKDVDRSCWTDTPADSARKKMEGVTGFPCSSTQPSALDQALAKKDKLYAEQVEKYNEAIRPKSLMDLHTEKLTGREKSKKKKSKKKKSKEKSKDKEEKEKKKDKHRKKSKSDKEGDKNAIVARRPFDRDIDLQRNRMDAASRQSLIKRSQQLSGRFGPGSSQFL